MKLIFCFSLNLLLFFIKMVLGWYYALGMLSALQQQAIQNGQEKWAGAIDYFTQMLAEQSIPNVNTPQEDKSHADT